MNFYVPPTLTADFDNFLKSPACHDINVCHDILAEDPLWIQERAEITKNNGKQRSFDRGVKLTLSTKTVVQKGDMIKFKDELYLVTTNVNDNQLNAKNAAMELVTIAFDFKRYEAATINEDTNEYISEAGYKDIIPQIRGILNFNGKANYSLGDAQVGIFPSNSLEVYIQANPSTLKLRRNDFFSLFHDTFVIRSVLYTDLNTDQKSGVLILQVENSNSGETNE